MGIPITKAELNHEGLILTRKIENLQKHIARIETKNKKLQEVVEAAEWAIRGADKDSTIVPVDYIVGAPEIDGLKAALKAFRKVLGGLK